MSDPLPSTPPENKPPTAKRQDFIIAVALVVLNGVLGFFVNQYLAGINMPLAITSTILITVCFCMRQYWARHAAMIVAVLMIIASALDFVDKALPATPISWIGLVIGGLTFYWLRRDGVKAWFPIPEKLKPKG